jgi:hypothetical protein
VQQTSIFIHVLEELDCPRTSIGTNDEVNDQQDAKEGRFDGL